MLGETTEPAARRAPPAAFVIFGASGDLTRRKLLPALYRLSTRDRLQPGIGVIGVARSDLGDDGFRTLAAEASGFPVPPEAAPRVRYVTGAYDDPATYERLAAVLGELERAYGMTNRLFYLSTPPSTFPQIAQGLAGAGLHLPRADSFSRIVVEKPFGHDLGSAVALDECIHAAFAENDVFRIDHYLAKETVQNLLALRFFNSIFEPVWNRNCIDHVQITVAETLGVEGRGGFYETAGALRDIVQNHVLQVLALALMEPPSSFDAEAVRNEKVKLLQSIRLPAADTIDRMAVRGQYTRGDGSDDPAYREEPDVDARSATETFVALRLDIDNWRWAGVPVYLRTGKRLPVRATEVVLQFHRVPHLPIPEGQLGSVHPDALVVRIQPDEGIRLRFGAKVPGYEFKVRSAEMKFFYEDTFEEETPEAYERVLLDALTGDRTLFIRSDEVERSWRIVDPIIDHWTHATDIPLYRAGSWGPVEADQLIAEAGRQWHNPRGSL